MWGLLPLFTSVFKDRGLSLILHVRQLNPILFLRGGVYFIFHWDFIGISLGLYLSSLVLMLLSLVIPMTSALRKNLLPVRFPQLTNVVQTARYTLGCLHLFTLGHLYAKITSSSVGIMIVSITSYLFTNRREKVLRDYLTSCAEASESFKSLRSESVLGFKKTRIFPIAVLVVLLALA